MQGERVTYAAFQWRYKQPERTTGYRSYSVILVAERSNDSYGPLPVAESNMKFGKCYNSVVYTTRK